MSRPSHFEMPVDDPDRAEAFYSKIFGWTFQRFEGAPSYYGMVTTGPESETPGINGGLFQRGTDSVVSITMNVPSIEEATKQVEAAGGKVVQGKTPIPGMGYFATCHDTEGNQFGLYENDESATMDGAPPA